MVLQQAPHTLQFEVLYRSLQVNYRYVIFWLMLLAPSPVKQPRDNIEITQEEWTITEIEQTLRTGPKPIRPTFIQEVPQLTVTETQEVIMEVTVDAHPPAEITWFVNGQPLEPSDKVSIFPGRNRSQIRLKQPQQGEYKAVATNVAGSATSIGSVTVESKF